jgi:STE24 endopeptidase
MATRMARVIVCSVPQRFRLPVAVLAALAVAEVAVLLMRPRDRLEPVPVAPQTYFSAEQIEKAVDFRGGQLWLYGLRLAIELGVLVLIVRRPPARLERAFRRPVLGGAAAAAAISVALTVVTLPVSAISRQRAIDVGLVTRSWPGWAGDVLQSTAIDAVLVGAGGALLVFGMRRFGRNWWAPAAALVVGFGVAITLLSPIVLDPLFNRFTPLPRGELRSDVLELAERAGVDVGQVYSMDASKRTTAANAYVAGLGHTKRVVLYDNLIEDFSPAEVRLVVAHELGHQHYDDVPRGLLYLALVAPLGMFAVARLGERLAPRDSLGTAAAVPAVVLAISLMLPAITMISNQLSREVEARADRYSMEQTGEPDALIAFQRRIAVQNVSDPDPPAWTTFLLGTHPTTVQRIGQALAVRSEEARGGAPREGS